MARLSSLARLAAAGLLLSAPMAQASGVLTVAMTAGDIPVTGGNPDQGFVQAQSWFQNLTPVSIAE